MPHSNDCSAPPAQVSRQASFGRGKRGEASSPAATRGRAAISKLRVLFFAEGATLAHVARPWLLARALDPCHFDVAFARPSSFGWLTADTAFRTFDLHCQGAPIFAARLAKGAPLYDYPTLSRYVDDDLALIDTEHPDVIIGDFRLSLSVSARLRAIPYITICDAYWSPESPLRTPLPVLNFTRYVPLPLARLAFLTLSRQVMRLHARPMERLRAHYGLDSFGFDLRRCYTDADLRLFANFERLFPDVRIGDSAAFLGPIAWSPASNARLDLGNGDDPVVYVTMGSSGNPGALAALVPILEKAGCRVFIATAGKPITPMNLSDRVQIHDYLPGDIVCAHARFVICNGGSPTTNQALMHGVPVVGIAENMDQFLNMQTISAFGAGILVRADRASTSVLREAVEAIMKNPSYADRARQLADSVKHNDPALRIAGFIDRLVPRSWPTDSCQHPSEHGFDSS